MIAMKCSCGKKAIFFRKYEGTHLCRICFCRSIERKFRKTVGKYHMISPGDHIVVALSGGKDSTTALYLMNGIVKPRRDIRLSAMIIDEGIRGFRSECIKAAKRFCKNLGVELHVFRFRDLYGKTTDHIMKKLNPEEEPCTYCGVARRRVINKMARKLKATKVCMGLHLDDEAESVLMNYLRGDLLRASRMGPVTEYSTTKNGGSLFVPRIKPLREIPEEEIKIYANIKKLDYYKKHCPYRGGFRFEVKAMLKKLEKKHPGMKFSILENFDKILPCLRKSVKYTEPKILKCRKCGEPSSRKICNACELWGN